MNQVVYKGKQYKLEDGKLDLTNQKVGKIGDIIGLENLTNLMELDLSNNSITEIEGLETLTHLELLNLRGNQIEQINGLETLTNLKYLYIYIINYLRLLDLKHLVN